MRRRDLLGALPAALAFHGPSAAQASGLGDAVRRKARALAARAYSAPANPLPPGFAELDYDGYRDLRFRPELAVWRGLGLPFQLQMFARSGPHSDRVELFEVVEGAIRPIRYRPELFVSGPLAPGTLAPNLGFAGFRIHAPINDPARFDEFAVFLGASYFRAVPRGGVYGLSARGIELGAGDDGEEFPTFRSFFIERPLPGVPSLTVHALLDGPSLAGAYRFVISPGAATLFEVTASLFPRRPLINAGIAPLTSMFLFGPEQPRRYDDFRPEVHDSDGLLVDAGPEGRLWRPLANPARAEVTRFERPLGFGLLQRSQTLDAYQDLEANYHLRPGAWAEPVDASAWNPGAARLVELPARTEAEDNIVA
ncbi:MAG: glucan biosynthesis protein, partial [Phenylobacterium sp.]|nr:glucan biosynthesis protein [Phenylobacterium sp.]